MNTALRREVLNNLDTPKLSVALSSNDRSKGLKAINEEFDTIVNNKTWTDDHGSSNGQRILPCGNILRVKRNEKGVDCRYKARLVVCENFQNEFEDYSELYAPVASIELVRRIFTISGR